ncbi:GNAT family N-acetyltransferase [Streptomyces sp. NBC_01445]|uniref:GNAT family N-acetyltransferase n=2 Tax=unclassified Streptomyces TaxID=2593676 RepID=UPI002DD99EE7|nr:GNAT family N-acetyltransferase [Streptomyces sp. NBC_01445]WSE09519.1 GNAT family N-acetyltransferase [Streptomyces sp. NBC_01445]
MTRIREASPGDVDAMVRLSGMVQRLHARHRPDLFVDEPSEAGMAERFRGWLREEASTLLVAESDEGEVVGYTFCRVERREGSLITRPAAVVSMEHLAVDPGSARSGVGAALVEAVRDVGRRAGCRRPVASVWEFNAAARPFYQAIGLRPMQVRMDQLL